MLQVRNQVPAETKDDSRDDGRKMIAADLTGVEIHPDARGNHGE